jgi:hypothetical protein
MPSDAKNGGPKEAAGPQASKPPVDNAGRLVKLAQSFAEKEPSSSHVDNAMIALQYLDQAANFSRDIRVRANTKAVAGFIYERYLGDFVAAVACYRAALEMVPGDQTLLEAVERLQGEIKARDDKGKRGESPRVGE